MAAVRFTGTRDGVQAPGAHGMIEGRSKINDYDENR